MSGFSDFCGSEALINRLQRQIDEGRLPHAILLLGERGTGRNLLARLVAERYLGDAHGLVRRGVHPDCARLEGEGASGDIRVGAVRDVTYEMNKSAVTADGRRVVLIEDAAHLNRSSSAALLKTLEQPPVGVVFILTASAETDVIDTVLSRCVRLHILPPPEDECAAFVARRCPEKSDADIRRFSRLFRGRIGLVLRALGDEAFGSALERAGRFAAAFQKGDRLAMMSALDVAASREELRDLMDAAVFCLSEKKPGAAEAAAVGCIEQMKRDLGHNVALKLFCTVLVERIVGEAQLRISA